MTTAEREEGHTERELDTLTNAAEDLTKLHARIAGHFRWAEVRERAHRFLEGLLAAVERKNGWQAANGTPFSTVPSICRRNGHKIVSAAGKQGSPSR